jgi:hypothetical protein
MKAFHCDSCGPRVFFENVACVRCGHVLAFLPDQLDVAALEPAEDDLWQAQGTDRSYRLCVNYAQAQVCNWAVPADDPDPLCQSCRLTRVIPDLSLPANQEAWRKLEAAKRRLLYSLLMLELPFKTRQEDPDTGLAFEFLGDAVTSEKPVLTGHDSGVITINVAEADDAEREKRRLLLHEPYRTLLGHLRHESGHYYWDLFLQNNGPLTQFRELFGDEQADYGEALQRHYDQGAQANWQDQFISAYASMHPWEDWAETWAHYLHMTDALETAAASGLSLAVDEAHVVSPADVAGRKILDTPFDTLLDHWLPLAFALNELSRSLGLPDSYPFVLSPPAIAKLRFTHELVQSM